MPSASVGMEIDRSPNRGMLVVETIARIRREFFVKDKSIKVGRFGRSPPPCMGSMVQSAISLVGESNRALRIAIR